MRSTLMSFRSNSSAKNSKYFPQQSSKKPRQKMPTIYRHKYYDKPYYYDSGYNNFNQNPELGLEKTQPLQKTRLDMYVQKEREQMVMKTGRTSSDNPEWMKTTFNYYKKSNFSPPSKLQILDQRDFNVLNNKRKSNFILNSQRAQDTYYKNLIKSQMSQSLQLRNTSNCNSPVDRKMRSTLNWTESNQRDVSPKVGALNTRDYTFRKPLLKIGKNQFINTYSPFDKF